MILTTLAQDQFDEHKDYVEIGDDGNVVGMWADYYESVIEPVIPDESEHESDYAVITYSGAKPEIKIKGSYKKFTVNFYNKDNEEIDYIEGGWLFVIFDKERPLPFEDGLIDMETHDTSPDLDINQIKIRFMGGNQYIGKVLRVFYRVNGNNIASVDVEIVSL